jgi:flagellar biosynthesis/type III secretory pathway protein FliH
MAGKRKQRRRRRDLDSPWKETLQHFLSAVLEFFFPRLHAAIDWSKGYESLDKEFHQIVAEAKAGRGLADKLFKVWRREDGRELWLLVHIEVQGQVERRFGRRMFRYNIRCFELYDRRVVSLAILCDDNPEWRPKGFTYGGWGSRTGIRFPTAKLLDYAGRESELEASKNPAAQVVLAHLQARATKGEVESRRSRKLRLVKNLYDRNWSPDEIRTLFRVIDWLMELPAELQEEFRNDLYRFEEERHMPYLSSFERLAKKEGREEGREEGRQEGREEGRQEGAREELLLTIQTLLKKKFGAAGSRTMAKVKLINELPRLRSLRNTLIETDELRAFRDLLEPQ